MTKPLLVTFVGIPGSGKTTFARHLGAHLGAVILNSDSIRIAMWRTREAIEATHTDTAERKFGNQLTFGAMNYAAEQIIAAGTSVIYDCNANKLSERQEKHDIADAHGALSVVVRIRVPYEVSLERITGRDEAHDSRRISTDRASGVLDRFISEIEEPTSPELVIDIDGTASSDAQLLAFDAAIQKL